MPGRHFLQIPGPTNVPERVQNAMHRGMINHRGEDMPPIQREVIAALKRLFGTVNGEIILSSGSGSGAMESSLVNTVGPGEKLLCFANGYFGQWYATLGRRLGADVEEVAIPWGDGVLPALVEERLRADREHHVKAVTVVHNDTSTGVTSDVAGVRRAMDAAGHPALLLVDTVSGLGCIEFRFDEWGVDAAVCGAQKGLMLPPGLAILCVSARAIEASRSVTTPRSFYDWLPVLEMLPSGMLPTTPPTGLFFGLQESLRMLEEEGLPNVYARHARLADAVRGAVGAWDLATVCNDPALHSNTITGIRLPEEVRSQDVMALAKEHLDLEIGGGIGAMQGRALRIGHMGSLNELEVLAIVGGTEMALAMAGHKLDVGAGVAAAQRSLSAKWGV